MMLKSWCVPQLSSASEFAVYPPQSLETEQFEKLRE
jgi:hypothetical protein